MWQVGEVVSEHLEELPVTYREASQLFKTNGGRLRQVWQNVTR